MSSLSKDLIGDAYTSTHAWDLLEKLTAIGSRMAGHEGEQAGARAVAQAFEHSGLRGVEQNKFEIHGWWRGSTTLTVESPMATRTFDAANELIALPGTPSGELNAELVDVGYGIPSDFEDVDLDGKLVLVMAGAPEAHNRWVHRNEKYAKAIERGARGFLFANDTPGCLPTTGSIGFDNETDAEVMGAGLSYEVGNRLQRFCDAGPTSAELAIDCRSESATSQNVEGVVGPDTDQEVVVTAHVDAHDIAEGAGDDGCGSVLVAEIGRLLAAAEDQLDTRVRLVTFGAEEIGMLGAAHWIETHDLDRVKCVINIDGVGDSSTLKVNNNGFIEIARAFEEVHSELGIPLESEAELRPHGDQWPFAKRGVPAAMTGSAGDGRFSYAHTAADTIDKINPRDLPPLAVALASGVLKLAEQEREVAHKSSLEMRDSMHSDYEAGLRAEGRWPWDDLKESGTVGAE